MKPKLKKIILIISGALLVIGGAVLCLFNWWAILGLFLVVAGLLLLQQSTKNLELIKTKKQDFKSFKEYAQTPAAQKMVKLLELKNSGLISDQEYETLKQQLIEKENNKNV